MKKEKWIIAAVAGAAAGAVAYTLLSKDIPDGATPVQPFDVARRLDFQDKTDDYLLSVKVPTLLMASDHDVITPEHTLKMAQLIPDAKLIILPGTHGEFIGASESGGQQDSRMPQIAAALIQDFLID